LELRGFGLFCAVFGDNLVTVADCRDLALMSVTGSLSSGPDSFRLEHGFAHGRDFLAALDRHGVEKRTLEPTVDH